MKAPSLNIGYQLNQSAPFFARVSFDVDTGQEVGSW